MYKVAITPCGKYVHGTEYDILSQVLNATEDGGDGCSYISIKRNRNVKPGTDPTVWAISTQRGEPGEPGSGFSYVEVSVDSTSGTPSATCRIENDTFYLDFFGLKGADGTPGVQGPPGADGQPGQPGQPGQDGQDGQDGIGFSDINTPSTADGTVQITLTNSDTITLDLNHEHPQYPKYYLCEDEQEYEEITTKDSATLYLILEEE